jgi:dihydroorotase
LIGQGGTLAVGADADVCVFDPVAFWAVTRETLRSQGKNTPWLQREMQSRVATTLVGGEVVYQL